MDVRSESTRLSLNRDESMLITDAAGAELLVCAGRVWLTQYGDSRDIVLRTGQSFTLERPLGLVMSAGAGEAHFVLRAASGRVARSRNWLERVRDFLSPPWNVGGVRRGLAGRIRAMRPA